MNPYSLPIDATTSNTFSCYLNAEGGTQINHYNLMIKDLKGNQVYSTGDRTISPVLYNNDILNIPIPANAGMINGLDYVWNVKLYENTPANWVTYGTVQAGTITASAFTIRKHFNVSMGMYVKLNTEFRQIASYDKTTGALTLSSPFSFTPSAEANYNIYSNFVESDDSYFKARKSPVVSITNHSAVVTGKSYAFVGAYSQSDNVGWKYFTWNLYSNGELAKSTGQMNTGEIKFSFDGFLNNTNYAIELVIETQDEIVLSSGLLDFNVQYLETSILNNPSVEQVSEKNALKVLWEQPYVNLYEMTGGYSFLKDEPYENAWSVLFQDDNCNLTYSISTSAGKKFIPNHSTTYLHVKFPLGFQGEFYRQENSITGEYYSIKYEDKAFIYDINGFYKGRLILPQPDAMWLLAKPQDFNPHRRYIWDDDAFWEDEDTIWCEQESDIVSERWLKFTLLPNKVDINRDAIWEMIPLPNVDYGAFERPFYHDINCGEFIDEFTGTINCGSFMDHVYGPLPSDAQEATNGYDMVTLKGGGVKFDYAWIENRIANDADMTKVNNFYFSPVWTGYTCFLAHFNNTLNAGSVGALNEQIIAWDIYKRTRDDNKLRHVNHVDAAVNAIVDHNVANMTEYQYHIFPITQNTVGETMLSPFVKTNWVGWTLLGVSPSDKELVYYADPKDVWTFRFNLGNSSTTQNFDRMIYEGHAKYPKVSTGERNYHSGTVSCLMGYVENSNYTDTARMQQDFEKFVQSETQKILKDSKGNVYLVEIMNNTFTTDNSLEQAITLNIEWCENGDAEKISVIERCGE